MTNKKHPIGGFSPGRHQCRCNTCGGAFFGDKRAYQCEPCAITEKEKFDAISPAEQEEIRIRNWEILANVFKPEDND